MNAPRQGLFACILIISFTLTSILIVLATTHQQKINRVAQGDLITNHLSKDSINELTPPNTVSLALLATRYATLPSVASIRILDPQGQVLATSGVAKNRSGDKFTTNVRQDNRNLGQIELNLIKPNIGETLRNLWLYLLGLLLVHLCVWISYRVVARPTRSEYLAQRKKEVSQNQQIESLKEKLAETEQRLDFTINNSKAAYLEEKSKLEKMGQRIKETKTDQTIAMHIAPHDSKNLMDTVSDNVSTPYFKLCQFLLECTLSHCKPLHQIKDQDIELSNDFDKTGVTLTIHDKSDNSIEFLMQVAQIFQLLSEVSQKKHRENKRFSLHTKVAITDVMPTMELDANAAAKRLSEHMSSRQVAIRFEDSKQYDYFDEKYEIEPLEHNTTNVITRDAKLVTGLSPDAAERAENGRNGILQQHN